MNSILIVAGENSGDKYGAGLINSFKELYPSYLFFGVGGRHMESKGVELIADLKELSIMGVEGVLKGFLRIKKLFKRIESEVKKRKPIASVLIDSPDFNLRLAKKLKKLSIPVLYYVSPTVWAWRESRLKTIKKYVNKMLLIFPFEKKIYESKGIPHKYVGHPVKEFITLRLSKEEFLKKYDLNPEQKTISLLPGSRRSEIKHHLPLLAESVEQIKASLPVQFILILAESLEKGTIEIFAPRGLEKVKIVEEDKYESLAYSDLVLSASGTANLEAALVSTPLISFYRTSGLNYLAIKLYQAFFPSTIKNFSIVNILAGEKIVPELFQNEFTPQNISREVKKILYSPNFRKQMRANFRKIDEILGEKKASQNSARELALLLDSPST
ncbi:MAG: lipid-A-disaccharide synthase [Candidatus Aminicenantales bacterium]